MRRSYKGAAQASALTSDLGGSTSDLIIYCNNLTNWPTGASSRPFYVVIDRSKTNEEKILCASRSGNILTVFDNGVTNGRGSDDTSITSHGINSTIEHVFTATDADEANLHVNSTSGVHGLSGAVVGLTDTQTLTNKTISGANNTVSSIAQASVTSLTADLAAKALLSIPIVAFTDNHTLDLTDAGKQLEMNYTSSSRVITTVALTSNVATLTTSAVHNMVAGDIVTVSNVTNNTNLFNGTYTITAVPTTTTFSYAKTNANIASAAATGTSPNSVKSPRFIIPTNAAVAFPIGSCFMFVYTGGLQPSFTADAGVTLNAVPGVKLRIQWSVAVAVKRDTNVWLLSGDLSA